MAREGRPQQNTSCLILIETPLSTLSAEEYSSFEDFLEKATGIVLGKNKEFLVVSRLKKLVLCKNIKNYSDLLVAANCDRRLRERIIGAMTTNETSWYRDKKIFDCLENNILPELIKNKNSNLKIWSTACSTGQEPYSVSMSIENSIKRYPAVNKHFEIVGTDISKAALEIARAGRYNEIVTARGLSELSKKKYFNEKGIHWEITDKIKNRVKFESINLKNSFLSLGKFDVIFCRNVLIYFSPCLKEDVLKRMTKQINPGGYLILGGAETMANYADSFEMHNVDSVVYYKLKD